MNTQLDKCNCKVAFREEIGEHFVDITLQHVADYMVRVLMCNKRSHILLRNRICSCEVEVRFEAQRLEC